MTRDEIVSVLLQDKFVPYMQEGDLQYIFDFIVENYKSDLPKGTDAAAEEYKKNNQVKAYWLDGEYVEEQTPVDVAFKDGVTWANGLGYTTVGIIVDEMAYDDISIPPIPNNIFKPGERVIVQIRKDE